MKLLRIKDLINILGVSRSTIYRLIDTGELTKVKISARTVGILEEDIEQFIKGKIHEGRRSIHLADSKLDEKKNRGTEPKSFDK
jgi:excisionase family DNA binding protein